MGAPPYLTPLLRKATDRYGSIRLTPPPVRIDIFKGSLAYSGSVLWNKGIPNFLKGVKSTPKFKKQFRHYLLTHWLLMNTCIFLLFCKCAVYFLFFEICRCSNDLF